MENILKMNLQFHAEEEIEEDVEQKLLDMIASGNHVDEQEEEDDDDVVDEIEDEEDDDEYDDLEDEEDDDLEDDEEDDEDDDEELVDEPKKSKKVPVKALQKERAKFNKRLAEIEAENARLKEEARVVKRMKEVDPRLSNLSTEQLLDNLELTEAQQHIKKGYSEDEARQIVRNKRELEATRKELEAIKMDKQIAELAKNPVYGDAEVYKDELIKLAQSKGLNLEQAYWTLLGDVNYKELAKKAERTQKYSKAKASASKIDTKSKTTKNKKTAQYTKEELAIMKKFGMQPGEDKKYGGKKYTID